MIRYVVSVIAVVFLGIFQVSFLTTWPWPVSSLNLILSLIIFLAVIISYPRALGWAFGCGLFLELYSGVFFGLTTLALILTVIAINFLFNNFFTNRSKYSLLIIGFLGTLIYNLIFLLGAAAAYYFNFFRREGLFDLWSIFFWQPIFNLIILMIIFLAYQLTSNRLKSIFLMSGVTNYEIKHRP